MESPVKLKAVNLCFNVDRLISTFVSRNKNELTSPQFIEVFQKTPKRKSQKATSTTFKRSLTDWRSLYQESRPQTQSLMGGIVCKRINGQIYHRRNESSSEFTSKRKIQFSPMETSTKFWANSPTSKNQKGGTRTAINFYRSPMKQQLKMVENLTSRIDKKSSTHHKGFHLKKVRKASHFDLSSYGQ